MEELTIKDRLLELPDIIFKMKEDLLEVNEQLELAEKDLKIIELSYKIDILNAVNEDGKKMYTNDDMRNAELQNRLKQDSEYADLKAKIHEQERAVQKTQIELEYLVNLQNNLRAICRLGGEE